MEGKWAPQIGKENKHQYNGKELDDEFGLNLYHYGFRMYDPAIGRFPSADPIAENFAFVSPYNYAENEPVGSIDLWGLQRHRVVDYSNEFRDGMISSDDKGIIRSATPAMRKNEPVKAAIADGTFLLLELMGLNALDNSVATLLDPEASVSEKVEAGGGLITPKRGGRGGRGGTKKIIIDGKKHPESARHAQEAIDNGVNNTGVIDRKGSKSRRRQNLKGTKTTKGNDRDEFPPAVIKPNGNVSVKPVKSGDNRGAGSSIGHQLRGVKNGTKVEIVPINVPNKKNK